MKKLLFLATLVTFTSCLVMDVNIGNGVSVDSEISVGDFNAIASHGSLDIIYTQTEGDQEIMLTCDENLVGYYDIRIEGGTLEIGVKRGAIIKPRVKSYLTIKSPAVNGISVSGSGDCKITSPLACDGDFKLKVSGSGSILAEGTVKCRDFSSSISGSGKITVAGVLAETAKFKESGSGSTSVDLLTADSITATISGSGGINLVCRDAGDIDASISGSGSVRLSGNARSLKSNRSGSGRVDSNDLTLGK